MVKGPKYYTVSSSVELDDSEVVTYLQLLMKQHVDNMNKRLNEYLFGNWVLLWVGEDGTLYFNWSDLPDKELLRARLTGKYKLGE